ncbi:hypothetical protein [Mariprofundus ferrooxydans]|uniref:Phage tail protein n=1 Tax=Mariprofundus ferrooxydans PV-1 TaxID=314345 RepID=Q0F1R8_9PROT|nr:hypothetical protein [Mariprofundus ferrooxydans]EAU55832.1 hypothetical protein SPV1_02752 [Mariprofundus ferrooxydans PV-1]KON47023.1 hypothetical protein AL013_10560 [Mariprofundus ferrooxydans]
MALEYDGEIVCEVNGQEVDVISFDETINTGRKAVKTMNRTGRARGSVNGVKTYDMKITAPAPAVGEFDWESMIDAQIVIYPVGNPTKRTTFVDSNTTSIGSRYQLEGEAVRDVSLYCLRRIKP